MLRFILFNSVRVNHSESSFFNNCLTSLSCPLLNGIDLLFTPFSRFSLITLNTSFAPFGLNVFVMPFKLLSSCFIELHPKSSNCVTMSSNNSVGFTLSAKNLVISSVSLGVVFQGMFNNALPVSFRDCSAHSAVALAAVLENGF